MKDSDRNVIPSIPSPPLLYMTSSCISNLHHKFLYFADKYNSQFGSVVNQYAYYHDEDESTFQLVDTARIQKPIYQRGRMKFNQVRALPEKCVYVGGVSKAGTFLTPNPKI